MMIGTRIGSRCFQQIDRFKLFAFLHVTKQHFSSGAAIFYRINGKLRDPDINCLFHPLSSSPFRVESAVPSLSIQHTFTTMYVRIINVVLRERSRRINSKIAFNMDGRWTNEKFKSCEFSFAVETVSSENNFANSGMGNFVPCFGGFFARERIIKYSFLAVQPVREIHFQRENDENFRERDNRVVDTRSLKTRM